MAKHKAKRLGDGEYEYRGFVLMNHYNATGNTWTARNIETRVHLGVFDTLRYAKERVDIHVDSRSKERA